MTPNASIAKLREVLNSSKNVVALAGAGLSAASGIPTFRGAGGLWRTHDAMSLATPEAFEANSSRVWQFYHYRREAALRASPNAAHNALAQLSHPARRGEILKHDTTFHFITQNVDGLSVRALRALPSDEGVIEPLEMHGRVLATRCTSCSHEEANEASPICEGLSGTEELSGIEREISLADLPRCQRCSGLLRPAVVWFGEMPKHLPEIEKILAACDLLLVVGTSSEVYPAAGFAEIVQTHGGKVAVFNIEPSTGDDEADFVITGRCEETLPAVLGLAPSPISAL